MSPTSTDSKSSQDCRRRTCRSAGGRRTACRAGVRLCWSGGRPNPRCGPSGRWFWTPKHRSPLLGAPRACLDAPLAVPTAQGRSSCACASMRRGSVVAALAAGASLSLPPLLLHMLLLLLVLSGRVANAQAKLPRGVDPQHASRYGGHDFSCLTTLGSDPPLVMPLQRVNDNYCDCVDGSDEPGEGDACVTIVAGAHVAARPAAVRSAAKPFEPSERPVRCLQARRRATMASSTAATRAIARS
eukprot:364523-Chlamydomonas_euryale.AAC.13